MSLLEVNKITPQSGTTLTLGDSGDTINFGSGVLPNFENLTVTGDLTVDTNSLYVDSANNRVGIGTTSPSQELHIVSAQPSLLLEDSDNNGQALIDVSGGNINISADPTGAVASSNIDFLVDNSQAMRITSAGNVGIGTTSPVGKLDVRGEQDFVNQDGVNDSGAINAVSDIDTNNGSDAVASLAFKAPYSTGNSDRVVYGAITGHKNNSVQGQRHGNLRFYTNSSSAVTERMRIDSSGNVLVGKTSTSSAVAGTTLWSGGYLNSTVASDYVARFNRTTTDGDIIQIYKDNSTVGSIGSISGVASYVVLDPRTSGGTGVGLRGANGSASGTEGVWPTTGTGGTNDGVIALGNSGNRFKDLYLSGNIYLGGTGSANALDDYEESDWTPTFAQGYNSITYLNQYGWYRKVGSLVVVSGAINFSATAANNALRINLPFTQTVRNYGGGGIPFVNISEFSDTDPYIGFNQTYVQFYEKGTGTNITTTTSPSNKWISFVVSMATS